MKAAIILIFLISSAAIFARGFEKPELSGAGCQQYSYAISPDGKALSILFDNFSVSIPTQNSTLSNDNDKISELNSKKESKQNRQIDHKICLMNLPVEAPTGFEIEELSIQVDLRGYVFAETGTTVGFASNFIGHKNFNNVITNRKVPVVKKSYSPQNGQTISEDFFATIEKKIKFTNICQHQNNKRVSFIIENALLAKANSNAQNSSAYLQMDSADHLIKKIDLKVKLKPCKH